MTRLLLCSPLSNSQSLVSGKVLANCSLFPLVATVGLQKTVYEVDENVGTVQLCAIVHRPNMSCPITFAFDIPVTTSKGNDINFSNICHLQCWHFRF